MYGSKKIVPEENCLPALILTLILHQTLNLTGGQISSGAIFRTPVCIFYVIHLEVYFYKRYRSSCQFNVLFGLPSLTLIIIVSMCNFERIQYILQLLHLFATNGFSTILGKLTLREMSPRKTTFQKIVPRKTNLSPAPEDFSKLFHRILPQRRHNDAENPLSPKLFGMCYHDVAHTCDTLLTKLWLREKCIRFYFDFVWNETRAIIVLFYQSKRGWYREMMSQ